MKYFILTEKLESYADSISKELYRLSRPIHTRNPNDVVTHYCAWITHSDGRVALQIPEDSVFIIHNETDPTTLVDLIGLRFPNLVKNTLKSRINNSKGRFESLITLLPTEFSTFLKTKEEMLADGWTV